jgi:pyruvate dehydrogenase E2 component (dihydrolipoamide acetyltransferase)
MTEGVVSEWLKAPGDAFRAGECLYVVENDKVANEIEAEADGVLLEITVSAGDVAPVGGVIGYWEGKGSESARRQVIPAIGPEISGNGGKGEKGEAEVATAPAPASDPRARNTDAGRRIIVSPYARKLAVQRDLPLAEIVGTGPNGRVVARDVEAASSAFVRSKPAPFIPAAPAAPEVPVFEPALPGQTLTAPSPTQSVIARRLVASKQEIPHFYLALDIDVTRLADLRKEVNSAQDTYRLTINHFIVMAVARALGRMPEVNSVWTDGGILSREQIDVGVAVSTDDGLLAPAVCDVGTLSMGPLAQRLDSLVERARAGRMNQRDLGHPAITVSNAGMHHVRYMTSIINPGQAMILGVGSIQSVFMPDADGQPELRRQMGVVLSADHRVLDGVRGLKFLNVVREFLEQPVRLLML